MSVAVGDVNDLASVRVDRSTFRTCIQRTLIAGVATAVTIAVRLYAGIHRPDRVEDFPAVIEVVRYTITVPVTAACRPHDPVSYTHLTLPTTSP
mgnify:CR=1 FL=1